MLWWCISLAMGARLARPQAGPALDLSTGIGWAGASQPVDVGGHLALGAWFGRYDDDFAIGRHGWIGVAGRIRARSARVEFAPLLEIRRGLDLLVVGLQGFVAGGVVGDVARSDGGSRPLGWTVIGGFVTRYRRTRHTSLILRLEGGVDVIAQRVTPVVGATVGVGWARPVGSATDGPG